MGYHRMKIGSSIYNAGVTQLARVTAFQAVGRGFESRLPLNELFGVFRKYYFQANADVAQLVEHILGKDEVTGSIPVVSSKEKSENKYTGK
jgi:hypothetical protein